VWLFRAILAVAILSAIALPAQSDTPSADPKSQFFAGNVTELSDTKVTVARTALGRNTVTKSFIVNAETKIDGNLRLKAKVTVRYTSSDDGDVAVEIIVRK
jgi:hypothetical protein